MGQAYIADKTFEKIDSTKTELLIGEYENCIFKGCNFSETNLSEFKFLECEFDACNLSVAKLLKTVFQDAKFKNCKMMGLHFDDCNPFGLSLYFEGCLLRHTSFFGLKLKKTVFMNCDLQECDFAESDLSASTFKNCDLTGATFDNTRLGSVDFRTSFNYSFDPEKNLIRKAKFDVPAVLRLFDKYDIEIDS